MNRDEFLIWREQKREESREMIKAKREHERAERLIKKDKLDKQPTHHVTHLGPVWFIWFCPRCPGAVHDNQ